jgi:hypothetical protein
MSLAANRLRPRRELRVAVRALRRRPLFSIAVVATLALAIGANTAIFTVVRAVLLRPLPFRDPDRLLAIHVRVPGSDTHPFAILDFFDARQARSFDGMVAWGSWNANLTGVDEPVTIPAQWTRPQRTTTQKPPSTETDPFAKSNQNKTQQPSTTNKTLPTPHPVLTTHPRAKKDVVTRSMCAAPPRRHRRSCDAPHTRRKPRVVAQQHIVAAAAPIERGGASPTPSPGA